MDEQFTTLPTLQTTSAAPRTLLSVQNVSRTFTVKGGSVPAVQNASFTIPDGSFTILYGPSGSGKSTLLSPVSNTARQMSAAR